MPAAMAFVAAVTLSPAALFAQPAPATTPARAPVESHAAPAQPAADPHAPAVGAPAPAGEHAQPAATQPAPADAHAAPAADAHGAPQGAAQGAHGEAAGEHASEEHHGESALAFASRVANFFILIGGLYYFLRKPLAEHFANRGQQVRADLVTAKETSAAAAAQLAEIDKKLQALPAEIETLKTRGKQEIAAEETRIRQAAEAERHRLIEQTRREVDLQVRLAKRELTEHAADLAVSLATQQIKQTITPDDQVRLVDRYVTDMRKAHD
jgi:F-type H+-transporting ATPase subunit b